MFKPVKNMKVYEQVVDQIKEMVRVGQIKKGDKLPTERVMAEELQVSRTSIREAMRALEVVGLIESRQGAGNYIREEFDDVLLEPLSIVFMLQNGTNKDIFELREVLELSTIFLSVMRISDEELKKLGELVERFKTSRDEEENVKIDSEFHSIIVKGANNVLITNLLEGVSELVDKFISEGRRAILSDERNRGKLLDFHEKIYLAIKNRDAEFIKNRAKIQAESGATYIDCCASVPEAQEVETLKWMIEQIQEVTDLPIAVDSPSADVILQAYKFCNKPGIINSVSMEGDKIDKIFPAIADTDWQVIALLSDDTGIPQTAEDRLRVFKNIMKKAEEYNIKPERIHIDPLVEMLCTSEDGIAMNVEVISTIRKEYPTIHITAAVSNISFNLPVRKLINLGFTVLAMNAGLDSAILDPTNRDMLGLIYATEALLGEDEYCIEYIGAYREGLIGPKK